MLRLSATRWVSKKVQHLSLDNFGNCRSISINLSVLISGRNYGGSWYSKLITTSNLLQHYFAKIERSAIQLYRVHTFVYLRV